MAQLENKEREELLKLSVKDLRIKAVKLGMTEAGAEVFETKKPLVATIEALSVKKLVEVEAPGHLKKEKKEYLSKREIMRRKLMKQRKVRILIPCQGTEKPGVIKWVKNEVNGIPEQKYVKGAYTPVQLNGFKWFVPHGVYAEVPEQVADQIASSQNVETENVGKAFLVDRADPKTGKSVKDTLE